MNKYNSIKYCLTFYLLFSFLEIKSQVFNEINLSSKLNETSGLETLDGYILTHNDSGNSSIIYFLDKNGEIVMEISYENLANRDWEDMTKDKNHLYIADTGNNFDTRKNLRILKFSIKDFEFQGEIEFNYPEQKKFDFILNSQFDSEGIISINNKIILFTKNREKNNTQVYEIPKKIGKYSAKKIGEIETNCIITGADFHLQSKTLALTGTTDFKDYFLLIFKDFSIEDLDFKKMSRIKIPINNIQVEAVKIISPAIYWISSENEENTSMAKLIKIKL